MLVLLVLAYMVISTTGTALPVFRAEGISFVTSTDWDPGNGHFGALAFIYGTVVTSVIALVIAVPLSLGVALFSDRVRAQAAARPHRRTRSTCWPRCPA